MAKKKVPLTPREEILQEIAQEEERLENTLQDMRERFIPAPTRTFKIGQRVAIGRLDNIHVLESLDDDKIIKVVYDHLEKEGSKTKASYGHIDYWAWTDVFPYRSQEENKKYISLKPVGMLDMHQKFKFYNKDVDSLIFDSYRRGYDVDTDYQRPLCWTLEDKRKLLDSMFNGCEIGKFAVIIRPYNPDVCVPNVEVLDGKQRISTLREFFEDRFTYKGKKFSELSWSDQHHLENYPVSYAEAEGLTQTEKYQYFLLLNVAGVAQSEEHMEYVKTLLEKV